MDRKPYLKRRQVQMKIKRKNTMLLQLAKVEGDKLSLKD